MPEESGSVALQLDAVVCPFCNSTDSELFSLFGQSLLASQYYCRSCHTVFEAVRWTDETPSQENAIHDPQRGQANTKKHVEKLSDPACPSWIFRVD